jgi:hypothetical protein
MNALTDARRNLTANFRSVVVTAALDPGSGRLDPPANVLARWLDEYHRAYVEANDEIHDGRLHLLQGRGLTIEGDRLLTSIEDIVILARAAMRGGMSTTIGVPVTALAAYAHAVAALRDALPSLQYRIDCSCLNSRSSATALAACHAALAAHVRAGGNVTLVGDVAPLRATGLLADELFNQTFISISPRRDDGVRPMRRAHRFAPCRDYIAWFIDARGEIYPCAGMLGHPPARFGSIHEPFARLVDALAYSERGIEALSRRGPRIADETLKFPADLCALHRQAVHGIASL